MRLIGKLLLGVVLVLGLSNCADEKVTEEIINNPDQVDTVIQEPTYLYGIPVDSFKVVGDKAVSYTHLTLPTTPYV